MSHSSQDLKIAVMGPTGAGKSFFIHSLTGDENVRVGNSLESETSELVPSRVEIDGRWVTFIDTPGFDDSRDGVSDGDILKKIALFLKNEYEDDNMLSGIVYMHRITDNRVGQTTRRNIRLFEKVCGPNALKNVIVATTMWGQVSEEDGARREAELSTNHHFFYPLLKQGAQIVRHDMGRTSALEIVSKILANNPVPIRLQEEIVDEHKSLAETAAGCQISAELDALIAKHEREMRELRAEMEEALRTKDAAARAEIEAIRQEQEDLKKEMQRRTDERQRLDETLMAFKSEMQALNAAHAEAETRRQHEEEERKRERQLQMERIQMMMMCGKLAFEFARLLDGR
ncbi:hypothetical protein A0H81_14861 [Grifola frondosa]|uniref:G domain-containing protein n=1 Tax=Grifola frondosa TaxID=5627 RepID=A0A1C7LKE3_GRIFR|nr:hypothetical protein A0H81_14861 [Grifola frondosa]